MRMPKDGDLESAWNEGWKAGYRQACKDLHVNSLQLSLDETFYEDVPGD